MSITLRTVGPEDQPFLLAVYATTRAAELAMTSWTAEQREAFVRMQFLAQDSFYREKYAEGDFKVILRDGEPVGRLYVAREPDLIRILDITVLPDFRNSGIGSALIQDLLDEAAKHGKRVRIYVETFNPSLALFQKRNFTVLEEDGINLLLEWKPATAAAEAS
jgi:ribosomal protein S18 acetylase RimI-like enzyme